MDFDKRLGAVGGFLPSLNCRAIVWVFSELQLFFKSLDKLLPSKQLGIGIDTRRGGGEGERF